MGALLAALDAALLGSGRTALLGGEPGIGKTFLASALAAEAQSRGVPVWWGRAFEDGSAPAFWPWNTALRRWIGQAGHEQVAAAAGAFASELADVFPVLREAMRDLGPATERGGCDTARFRLFDLVRRFLAAAAEPAGLVVVLDDVHWADQPSLKLLELVAGDLADARVLVVATYRDTELRRDDLCSATLSRLAREPSTRRIEIGGLSPADCARWLGLLGGRRHEAPLAEALHRETNGNPLFVREFVHLLAREGDVAAAWDGTRVPQGVRDVVSLRLDRLGAECRATLAAAALLGDTIDAELLARLLDDARWADHLERALRERILVAGEAPGLYAFAHALMRRVLLDELTPTGRAAWHARIAAVLERHAAASQERTTELVRHLAAAGTSDALRKAVDYACRGAEQAARGLGWEEAVRLYEVALEVGKRSDALDAARAIEIELALARALRAAGDVPRARARCESVMAACRRRPNPEAFARAALIHAGPYAEWGRLEPSVRAVLEEAARAGAALDDALRARLYGRLAGDIVAVNERRQGARVYALCDEAAAAARRAGDDGALAIALTGIYYAAAMGMRREGDDVPLPTIEEILTVAEAGGEHAFAAAIRHARAMTMLALGAPDEFSAEIDGVATAAAASRAPEAVWLADALAALRATVQGRFAEAHEAIERARSFGSRMQLPNAVPVHTGQRVMWHAFQGRLAEMASEIDAFVEEHPGGSAWRPFRALARLAAGDAVA
ncbi:MAG: AAA family ATPase, partial [Thermodesulfobacteriota bacterium]